MHIGLTAGLTAAPNTAELSKEEIVRLAKEGSAIPVKKVERAIKRPREKRAK